MLIDTVKALGDIHDKGPVFVGTGAGEQRYTFAELVTRVRACQASLQASGLEQGDRVALALSDSEEFVTMFLGAVLAGIIPVPMYPPMTVGTIESYRDTAARILARSGARAVVCSDAVVPALAPLVADIGSLERVLAPGDLEAAGADDARDVAVAPDDVCFLQFTSGSTSHPKGVIVTHENLAVNSRALMSAMNADSDRDVGVSWLPLYHDMGLIGKVLAPLFFAVPVVFIPTVRFIKNPRIWMSTVSRCRGTITFAPNFAFALACKRATPRHVAELDLRSLRVLGCGSEPIRADVLREFRDAYAPAGLAPEAIMPCYGMAEATLAISFSRLDAPFASARLDLDAYRQDRAVVAGAADDAPVHEVVACGATFPGHELRIADDEGAPLPEGRIGEVWFRGPSVTAGYFGDPDATRTSYRPDGWLRTGDLGFLLDGELYISGRSKDLIIVNGRNCYPQALEWAAETVEGVRAGTAVAFSVAGRNTERVVILIGKQYLDDSARRVTAEVKEACAAELGVQVSEVVFCAAADIPKTTSGKVQRGRVRSAYERGEYERPAQS